jgi:hypothetical protein
MKEQVHVGSAIELTVFHFHHHHFQVENAQPIIPMNYQIANESQVFIVTGSVIQSQSHFSSTGVVVAVFTSKIS